MSGPVTVRETLPHLTAWGAQLVAGENGLDRAVSWASLMRAQLPAFQDLRRGELAVLSLASVQALQDRGAPISLLTVLDQLVSLDAAGAIIAGLTPANALPRPLASMARELRARADQLALPIIALPQQAPLADVRAAILALVAERRDRPTSPLEPVDAYAAQMRASLRSEALEALLAGAYVGEAQMRMRASHLGYDLNQPHIVLWVQLHAAAAHNAHARCQIRCQIRWRTRSGAQPCARRGAASGAGRMDAGARARSGDRATAAWPRPQPARPRRARGDADHADARRRAGSARARVGSGTG